MAIDPYKVLGVRRNASAAKVKAAYRKRSMQEHPDRNPGDDGAASRFHDVSLAYRVLSDPARRARYDATGEVDEGAPDNANAAVIGVLNGALVAAVTALLDKGAKVAENDVVALMRQALEQAGREMAKNLKRVAEAKGMLEETLTRLAESGDSPFLSLAIRGQLSQVEQQSASMERQRETNQRALAHLKSCAFRCDKRVVGYAAFVTAGTATMGAW